MTNKYLEKVAQIISEEDARIVVYPAAVGAASGLAATPLTLAAAYPFLGSPVLKEAVPLTKALTIRGAATGAGIGAAGLALKKFMESRDR